MLLGELLVKRGWATQEQVDQASAEQERLRAAGHDIWLGHILLRWGHVKPEHLTKALAEQELEDAGYGSP